MKEVRLNDRLWFGKHKGARLCELIKGDPAHIQKLISDQKIKLDPKAQNLFDEKVGRRFRDYADLQVGRPMEAPIGFGDIHHPGQVNRNNDVIQANVSINVAQLQQIRDIMNALVRDIFRNTGVGNQVLNHIHLTLFRKFTELNIPPTDLRIGLTRLNQDRLAPSDIVMSVRNLVTGENYGSFDIS